MRALASALLLAAARPGSTVGVYGDYATYKLGALKRMLIVRGVECKTCETKEDYVAQVKLHAELPVRPELVEEYELNKAYDKQRKDFNVTREEFVSQMAATHGALSPAAEERMWTFFLLQLELGIVTFQDNGTIGFSLPITHRLSSVLPAAITDPIERVHAYLRTSYARAVPRRHQRRINEWADWLIESGTLVALVVVILSLVLLDVGYEAFSSRRAARAAAPAAAPAPAAAS